MIGARILLSFSLLLSLSRCGGIGPMTVPRDRFNYTVAISDSWKRQMLLNIVMIRYGDAPVFMDVSSVISQYQVTGLVTLGAKVTPESATRSDSFGASGQYIDRPTITYTPLLGEKFARSLSSPIPPSALTGLIQTGYRLDVVFRAMVDEINGIRNRLGGESRSHTADSEFYTLIEKMRKIQEAGGIGKRIEKTGNEETVWLIIRGRGNPETEALAMEVKKLLGLDPRASEFHVVYGAFAANDKEIALLTKSVMEVLTDLSADIEVPAEDVREERVSPVFEETIAGKKIRPLVRILSSSGKPLDAYVSVPYRNSYFFIDDRDLMSKRVFASLMFIFALVETGEKGAVPLVTIPTR